MWLTTDQFSPCHKPTLCDIIDRRKLWRIIHEYGSSGRTEDSSKRRHMGTILNKSSRFICFADDVDEIGRTFGTVTGAYVRLKHEVELNVLSINVADIKNMLAGGTERIKINSHSNVVNDGDGRGVHLLCLAGDNRQQYHP